MKALYTLVLCCLLFVIAACKKESFITSANANVLLPSDTLRFDTVFTTVGSVTQVFKILNNNNQKLHVSNVTLKGGTASAFKINVDGIAGPTVNNIEIEANDSVYVFVSVNINPDNSSLPFIINDSIEVGYNGVQRYVQLQAWGQNAHFLRNQNITGNVTWTNDRPYVIVGALRVDTLATLTIEKGTRVYLHADAPFIVDGTLKVKGESFDSTRVYFRSDRLDEPYKNFPGSWPGIYFRGKSKNNELDYAVVQNAYQGVIVEQASINANSKLVMRQCIIDNIYDVGIYGVQTSITAENCLVSNCGKNVQLLYGGNYNFTNCTVATIANSYIAHKDPVLIVTNNVKQENRLLVADINAVFQNCIFWAESGVVDDEVIVSREGSTFFNVQFNNCLWKVKNTPGNAVVSNIINNQPPLFDSTDAARRFFDFRLKAASPAINQGMATSLNIDLDGKSRAVGVPDMGAYERQ